ncbi:MULTISPECIES: choline binding-anchored murein hydrolase CbpD [unclassified Streptococcus]|uniref:choline binding-anchored murein hydrolase CbpD n=1 Tax=unclassified Streptococcus TaxID=2608887 RepID=UPI001565D6FD|nr:MULTISPECIES: choline binding-anchored murein hydrolase CbpD [unclassified Streptococcus]
MKILPFKVTETRFSFRKSAKKVVPFLVVGLMLAASDSVYAYSGGNGSIARGDDYPVHYKNGSQEIDQWRMYSRQCTSFAAFRLSNVNGFEIPRAYGNANEWGHRARREGYRVDNTPTIGSIAWSTAGTYGHVAWVSNVMGDQIEIEEYNYGYTEAYNKRSIKANMMTGFIHFKDLAGGSVGNSQTSVSTGGTHYFKSKSAIKNQPLASATAIDYYYPGENVHYDQILEKDGYKWLSYTAYNGSYRYVQLEAVNKNPLGNSSLSSTGGTHYFKSKSAIKNQPLVSATAIDYYYPGEKVHYDQILEKDGYKWLSYTAYNGSRRYIQLEGVTSSQNYQNQSGNSSNYSSNNGSTVGWKKINGSWYHFKSNGSKSTGWLKDGSSWYYLKSSGEMQIGWLKENGSWYYLDSSGAMKTGWYQVSGKWYYSYSSGVLAVNTTVDGYRVNSDGERV